MCAATPETESATPARHRTPRFLVFRSVKLLAVLIAGTLIIALIVFGGVTWRGLQHFGPLEEHTEALTHLQQTGLRLEELTIEGLSGGGLPQARIEAVQRDVSAAIASDGYLAPETPQRLIAVEATLSQLADDERPALLSAIGQFRQMLTAETLAHAELLSEVRHDLALEFAVIGAAVLALSSLGMLTLARIRRHVFGPLNTLEQLLALLANRDYSLAPVENVDPIVQPLTSSYNHLVNRLIELEAENARHRDTLEQEVRTATAALLEQQRSLATAERLAAAGEIAARIAHELRNPLAGMQMALTNIRAECSDRDDVVQRLDLVIDELRRITGLLNGLLDQSRTTPEPAVELPLSRTVEELLAILRYQIPKSIRLCRDIPDDLVCFLPRDRLRQILLNLVLNSSQAIGQNSGTVTLRAAIADDALTLTVCDDGPGFPPTLLQNGIGPFRTGRPGGTGLGLSIVSRHVRNLDGRVELSNLEPHGACVKLILPCRGSNA